MGKNYIMPCYGQYIWVSCRYARKKTGRSRDWKKKPYAAHGLYLGIRTLKNGYSINGESFRPAEHFQAALFSPGPNHSPIYVPIEAIRI